MGITNFFNRKESRQEWRELVSIIRREHPEWSLKQCLKEAKRRYNR